MTRFLTAILALALLAACGGAATTTTSPSPEPLPEFQHGSTVEPGDRFSFTMSVTCGEAFEANGSWWVASEKFFEHPNYPAGWPVEVLNGSAADGPDALIEGELTVVDAETIEFNLVDGTPVAVYTPGDPLFCG